MWGILCEMFVKSVKYDDFSVNYKYKDENLLRIAPKTFTMKPSQLSLYPIYKENTKNYVILLRYQIPYSNPLNV